MLQQMLSSLACVLVGMSLLAGAVLASEPPDQDKGVAADAHGPFERVGVVDGTVPIHGAFDSTGSRFVTKVGEAVRVWDSRTLEPISSTLAHVGLDDFMGSLSYFGISGDGQTVFTAAGDEIRLWDVQTSKVRCSSHAGREISFATINFDGSLFVTVTPRGPAGVWRAGEPRPFATLSHDTNVAQSAEFDRSGKRLVTHAWRGPFRLWSTETGELIRLMKSDDDYSAPYRAGFDFAGERAIIPRKGGVEIIDCLTSETKSSVDFGEAPTTLYSARFSTDGRFVSVNVEDTRNTLIYDAETGELRRRLGRLLYKCQLINNGHWAIGGHSSKVLGPKSELWDVHADVLMQSIPGTFRSVDSRGSSLLLKVPAEDRTSVWRVRSEQPLTQPATGKANGP